MQVATIRQTVARRMQGRAWVAAALGGCLALAWAGGTQAAPERWRNDGRWQPVDRDWQAQQGPIAVSVTVEGRRSPLFQAASRPDRWYLEAKERARYEVRVTNVTGQRVGFVLSVDGINAINGRRSFLTATEPMYVLGPHESSVIKGWRRSLNQVNRFVFVDEERSYAERTGQANGDLGWIRVAAFRERQDWIGYREGSPYDSRKGAPRAEGAPRSTGPMARGDGYEQPGDEGDHPGTGWGRAEQDRVRRVDFDPERFAAAQVILRYEYRSALVALGILPWRGNDRDRLWERENGVYGFAQPPSDW